MGNRPVERPIGTNLGSRITTPRHVVFAARDDDLVGYPLLSGVTHAQRGFGQRTGLVVDKRSNRHKKGRITALLFGAMNLGLELVHGVGRTACEQGFLAKEVFLVVVADV